MGCVRGVAELPLRVARASNGNPLRQLSNILSALFGLAPRSAAPAITWDHPRLGRFRYHLFSWGNDVPASGFDAFSYRAARSIPLLFACLAVAGAAPANEPPPFLAEIVFRHGETLFLARDLIRPAPVLRWPPLPVVGYDRRGERVFFNNPFHGRAQRLDTVVRDGKVVRTSPPDSTTYYCVNLCRREAGDKRPVEIGLLAEGDMMNAIPCPEPREPAVVLFVSAAYRIERLTRPRRPASSRSPTTRSSASGGSTPSVRN